VLQPIEGLLKEAVGLYHASKTVILRALTSLLVAREGRSFGDMYPHGVHDFATQLISALQANTESLLGRAFLAIDGYGMVWYGMVWYGMVWYGMVWYGIEVI